MYVRIIQLFYALAIIIICDMNRICGVFVWSFGQIESECMILDFDHDFELIFLVLCT